MLPLCCTRKGFFSALHLHLSGGNSWEFKKKCRHRPAFWNISAPGGGVCVSSRALEAAGWVEGAGASPCCSSRALIFGSAGLARRRAAGRLLGCRYLLPIWDLLKCVHPDASPCLALLLAARRICTHTCPVTPWPVSEMRAACGIAFTPSLAWGSQTRGAGRGSEEILSRVSGVSEESLTPVRFVSLYCFFLPQKSPPKPCKDVGDVTCPALSLQQPWGGRRPQPGSA